MTDQEIDTSDIAPLDEEFFSNAEFRSPKGKVSVLLSIDEEIAEWFQRQEGDFRLHLNNALRQYKDSHR